MQKIKEHYYILLFLKKIIEFMELLASLKIENQRSKQLSALFLSIHELQIIFLLLWPTFQPLFLKIAELFLIFMLQPNQQFQDHSNIVILIFGFNMLMLFMFLLSYPLKNFSCSKNMNLALAMVISLFRYILMIPTLILAFTVLKQEDNLYMKMLSGINLSFAIIFSLIEFYSNWSYRFMERDYCNRRNMSIIEFILLIIFVALCILFNNLYSSLILLLSSVLRIYSIFKNIEYPLIQFIGLFFSLSHIYLSILYLIWNVQHNKQISFQFTCFTLFIGGYILFKSTAPICFYINTECLFKGYIKLESGNQDKPEEEISAEIGDNDQIMNELINQIVMLSRILQSQMNLSSDKDSSLTEENRYLWQHFEKIIMMHKVKCTNPQCKCKIKKKYTENDEQLFIENITKDLSNALNINNKEQKIKLMNICLYIEIAKKPLKGFYEIIKMQKEKLSITTNIDLKYLIRQTRECFDQIFLKNDVQNQDLPLFKMIEFEELIQSTEGELRSTIQETINFLDMFTYSSVKMQQVEIDSAKLFEKKDKINSMLENLVVNCHENTHVNFMVMIFYRYVEVYRSREAEFRMIENEKLMKKRFFQKSQVNVFSSEYGAIYIDLIEERGKIKKLTQNICDAYGYNKEDMVSFNINQFMPNIFGRFHAKFLSNFIEKGKIKILKEKQRILFAKNKKKFIFPLNVRLKTQHLFDNEFGASGLIKKMTTDSDFVIIGRRGKIQEITEKLYKKIFSKAFRDQITKVNKLCIFKMIPKLMTFKFAQISETCNKVYESFWIYSMMDDVLLEKFRYARECIKGSKSVSYSIDSTSFVEDSMQSEGKRNKFFQKEYFAETFKFFLSEIDILKLAVMKVTFKISKLITEEFELLLLQVISVNELHHNPKENFKQILSEYESASEFLQINEEQGTVEKNLMKYQELLSNEEEIKLEKVETSQKDAHHPKRKMSKRAQVKSKKVLEDGFYESVIFEDESDSINFFQEQDAPKIENVRGNSEQSSVIGNSENQSKKQILINAFNSKDTGLPCKILLCLNLILGLMLIMLGVYSAKSALFYQESVSFLEGSNYLLSLSQIYEYRMALLEMGQFYQNKLSLPTTQIEKEKRKLQQNLQKLVESINEKTLSIEEFSEIYERKILLYNPILKEEVEEPLIELMSNLLYMFQDENGDFNIQTLRLNYQKVHDTFRTYQEEEKEKTKKIHEQKYFEVLIFFALYECLVLGMSIIVLPLLVHYKQKEAFILNLLSYMSIKDLRKAKMKLKKLFDAIKNMKSAGFQIQNDLMNCEEDLGQIQNHYNKSIKLITEENEHILKQAPIYFLLLAFFLLFSILSITTFIFTLNNSSFFDKAVEVNEFSHNFANKVPVLINVYLSNINRVEKGEAPVSFSSSLYQQANHQYYEVIEVLSTERYSQIELLWKQHSRLIGIICEQVNCNDPHSKFSDIILQFKNQFSVWEPRKKGISFINESSIDEWVDSSNIEISLEWVDELIAYSFAIEKKFLDQTQVNLNNVYELLLIMSGILIPVYILLGIIIEYKLIDLLSGILKNAESVYMHFPVSVLIENTYLTSYFNEKIKQSK